MVNKVLNRNTVDFIKLQLKLKTKSRSENQTFLIGFGVLCYIQTIRVKYIRVKFPDCKFFAKLFTIFTLNRSTKCIYTDLFKVITMSFRRKFQFLDFLNLYYVDMKFFPLIYLYIN